MKLSFILGFLLFTINSFGQNYNLYSDIWIYSKEMKRILPKDGGNFSYPSLDVLDKIDTVIINGYLLESFNKFRSDYGKPSVYEDPILTSQSKSYAKQLNNNFVHDPNIPKTNDEVIANISFILISKIDCNKFNINKIISDCVFDIFISSDDHMSMLLNDSYSKFGFGVVQNKSSFSICIRALK